MPRYAKANQSIKSLKALIKKSTDQAYLNDNGEGCPYGILNGDDAAQKLVKKDLSKIDVDFENAEYISEYHDLPGVKSLEDFEMIGSDAGAFPVAWCVCHGEWEYPLAFVLYIGQEGELRAYIPKDGNVYNKKAKAAYGNNDGDPEFEACIFDDVTDPLLMFDADKLRADVAGRIEVKDADKKRSMNVNGNVTFRQLIQSLRDYKDQLASVMPYAEGGRRRPAGASATSGLRMAS